MLCRSGNNFYFFVFLSHWCAGCWNIIWDFQPIKLMTVKWRTRCAKMKSAKALSGLILVNWPLLAGLTWSLRQAASKTRMSLENFWITANWQHHAGGRVSPAEHKTEYVIFDNKTLTTENKRANAGNESTEERVERECTDETTVDELDDSSHQHIKQVSVDQLQFSRRRFQVIIVEFGNHCRDTGRHY